MVAPVSLAGPAAAGLAWAAGALPAPVVVRGAVGLGAGVDETSRSGVATTEASLDALVSVTGWKLRSEDARDDAGRGTLLGAAERPERGAVEALLGPEPPFAGEGRLDPGLDSTGLLSRADW